jgi:hypothetical protein
LWSLPSEPSVRKRLINDSILPLIIFGFVFAEDEKMAQASCHHSLIEE